MPGKTHGDFGFVAFGAEKSSADATYRFLDASWNVASEGYVSATATPEPATWLLLMSGGATLVLARRARRLVSA